MKMKFLSVLLAVCMVFTLAPFAMAEEVFDTWDGSTITTPTTDSDGVYQINSASDFVGFMQLVNGSQSSVSAELNVNVDLAGATFTPIGSFTKQYTGNFNGNGNTIRNATFINQINPTATNFIHVGLFGCVNGTVQNFTLDTITVTNTDSSSGGDDDEQAATGAAVGMLFGGTVKQVIVEDTCHVTGTYRTGGIVGSSKNEGTTVSDCINHATVTGSGNYTGGIIGAAHNVTTPTATGTIMGSCTNTGTVSGTSEVGGIVGYTDRAEITNCENSGTVTGTGNYGVGGIVGCDVHNYSSLASIFPFLRPSNGSTIKSCINSGAVSGPRVGGILGSFVVAPGKTQPSSTIYSTIDDCTNTGAISSTGSNGKCGAIYGAPISYASGDGADAVNCMFVNIKNCKVGGSVNSTAPTQEGLNAFISPSDYVSLSDNTLYNGDGQE